MFSKSGGEYRQFGSYRGNGGVHSELNISNMGRFRILSDRTVELSAVCPQKTIKYLIGSRSIGTVRYNGSGFGALTDGRIYVVAAAL